MAFDHCPLCVEYNVYDGENLVCGGLLDSWIAGFLDFWITR